jgi:hypothetical protein
MFVNKQLVRKYIFITFAILISIVSIGITVNFLKEETLIGEKTPMESECMNHYFIGSFILKTLLAFFAGGMVSDKIFIRMGIV